MRRLFGTDGIRGVANVELTPELVYNLGRAAAFVLAGDLQHKPRFLIGRDTRISGDMLAAALTAGFTSAGADVYDGGVLTTPAVAHLVITEDFDCGAMISASHNPFEFNGIKLFDASGYKLHDELEDEIEAEMHSGSARRASGTAMGQRIYYPQGLEIYHDWLKETLLLDLSGMHLAVDCANGSASVIAPQLLRELGAELEIIGAEPNGININERCGSTHTENLQELVVARGCSMGIAYDGDADRFLAVDEFGQKIDGDQIMAIIAREMAADGRLRENTVVATVMSNLGFARYCEANNLKLIRTKVGDRYVLEEMLQGNYNLGGEQSGHVILLDEATTGDGILTSLHLLRALQRREETISAALADYKLLPQVLKQVMVPNNEMKQLLMEDPLIKSELKRHETLLEGKGRLLVRPSGTEPVIRVMLEGEDLDDITDRCDTLVQLFSNAVLERMAKV